MWSQGCLHCSPSPGGAGSAQWRIAEASPGSRDGLWGHHSPPSWDFAASQPQIRSVWGTATSLCHASAGRGPSRDSVQLAEFVAATGLLSITLDGVGRDLAAESGAPPGFWHTSLGPGFAVGEMHSIYVVVVKKTFVGRVVELAPAVLTFSKYPQDPKIANAQICKEWWAILRVVLDPVPSIKEERAGHSVEFLLKHGWEQWFVSLYTHQSHRNCCLCCFVLLFVPKAIEFKDFIFQEVSIQLLTPCAHHLVLKQ